MFTIDNLIRLIAAAIFVVCVLSLFNIIGERVAFYTTPILGFMIVIAWLRARRPQN